jgi:hypothetical protein
MTNFLQDSVISIEHFRFIMQSLPKGDATRAGRHGIHRIFHIIFTIKYRFYKSLPKRRERFTSEFIYCTLPCTIPALMFVIE